MYVFDNAAPGARARLAALADVHDPETIRHLVATGVTDRWQCLEVGGGLGTITRWLSHRVGPTGHVLTTDIDTRFLATLGLANVEVRRHDILTDPLPDRAFDLAYARLVLEHLANPDVALDRMTAAIRPGGWLVVQDFEIPPAVAGPDEPVDRISRSMAAMRQVTATAGASPRLGLSLATRLRARGLAHVDCEGRMRLCRGNTAAARLARLNFEQLREPMLATGQLTTEQLDADLARLDDEDYEWRSPVLWTAWGQRPLGEST